MGVLGKAIGLFSGGGGMSGLANAAVGLVGKWTGDKDQARALLQEVDMAEIAVGLEEYLAEIGLEQRVLDIEETAASGVAAQNLADAQSDDPVQRQWRPKASLKLVNLLIAVVCAEYVLSLVQIIWFPESHIDFSFKYTRELLAGVFGLLSVYMGGRTFEKIRGVAK